MGDLLCVDFKTRSKSYTRNPADKVSEGPTDFKAIEAEIAAAMFASGLDTPIETLAAFYESSLGFVPGFAAPDQDPA